MKRILTIVIVLIASAFAFGQRQLGSRPTPTGGPLKFEQAVYDVQSYDVTLKVDVASKSIIGTTVMTARTTIPTDVILLDLDTPFTISKVTDGNGKELKYER